MSNSEIDRAGIGGRVMELAGKGSIPPRIAETVSQESGHDISVPMVRRYLQKNSLNAATNETRALEMLAAAISGMPSTRDSADANTTYFGRYKLNTKNIFDRYYAVAREVSGQVERGFVNLALKITNGARIVGAEKDAEKVNALMNVIDFSSLLQDVVRSTCEMGTCVVILKSKDGELITPQISPISYITLLTKGETPGTVDDHLVHGQITQVIHDEGSDNQIKYDREDVALFRVWSGANYFNDIQGRPTYSVYGRSMTVGVETPLKSLMNSSYYYDEFIKRYGIGRLHIDLKLLADLIKEKAITSTAAGKTVEDETAALQKISANEDIITTGENVSMIESKTGFDIVPYLKFREAQVNHALLQSDVAGGEVGSGWTSAGTAVSAQELVTLQSLRDTLFRTFMNEIVLPRLSEPEFNLDPKTLSITAEPLSNVPVPYNVLTDWVDRGIIAESEVRIRGGFSDSKPEEM